MALAAAVLKAVNSAMYGLRGRVQSVQQAITYLGTREVAAVTFEMGLRAVFPPAPELEPVWERARVRGLLMGRHRPASSASTPGPRIRPACSRNAARRSCSATRTERYRPMLREAKNDEELLMLEHTHFGVSHDALGAALCESWGLGAAGGRQRALSRHRQQHAASCRCTCSGARSAPCRRWPMP